MPAYTPTAAQVNGIKDASVPCSVLLPHEVVHSLATCDADLLFESLMLGCLGPQDIRNFWLHVRELEPWKDHPDLQDDSQDFSRLIGLQVHGDGAELYRDSEYFVYSWSSVFSGSQQLETDVMLNRFPLLVVAERHMQQESVPWFNHYCGF